MKKLIIITLLMGAVYSCEKENISPVSTEQKSTVQNGPTPQAIIGNDKDKIKCVVKNENGRVLAEGISCKGKGNECGRQTICYTSYYPTVQFPSNEVIFEDLTRAQFHKMWNSEEGHDYLVKKGVYEEDAE